MRPSCSAAIIFSGAIFMIPAEQRKAAVDEVTTLRACPLPKAHSGSNEM